MKRMFLAILAIIIFSGLAHADYSITMTWTHSVGPNLKNEKAFIDGVEISECNVLAADSATCTFVVTDLSGQEITMQAFNTQDVGSDIYVVGNLLEIPAPPTGGMFTITHIP